MNCDFIGRKTYKIHGKMVTIPSRLISGRRIERLDGMVLAINEESCCEDECIGKPYNFLSICNPQHYYARESLDAMDLVLKENKIFIPKMYQKFCGFDDKLEYIGAGDRMEIWKSGEFDEFGAKFAETHGEDWKNKLGNFGEWLYEICKEKREKPKDI
tara:strand:- start:203 stop:676 length:474 start_codon:yes stop_codon:yes gene_type:complete